MRCLDCFLLVSVQVIERLQEEEGLGVPAKLVKEVIDRHLVQLQGMIRCLCS